MPPLAKNIATSFLCYLDNHKLLSLCLSVLVVFIALFSYVSIAQAKYMQSLDRDLSLTVGGETTTISYVPNDTKAGLTGHFESGKTSAQTMEQEKYRLFNVPATEDNHVDNPVPDNNLYKFEYWYALDSSNNEIAYKNLNSTVCDDDNWPPGNTFYAKFTIVLGITYDSTSGTFDDGTTKQVVSQTAGEAFKKPDNDPTWVVESLAKNPEFDYWYEIDESGAHIEWTEEMFSRTVSADLMPRNNILYAEWKSDDFIVEFDAREDLGGHFDDGSFIRLVPQTEGDAFSLPSDPENSTGTFVHWNLNKYVDEESTRITTSSTVKAEHNHIRVYAHYTFDKHRVTVMVANPESGGQIQFYDEILDPTHQTPLYDTQTYYDAPDLVDGHKLHYSLTADYVNDVLVGQVLFTRGEREAKVFSSNNSTSAIVFSRFEIEETQTGKFPGWEGDLNTDLTIKLYFSDSSFEAYWVANNTGGPVSIDTENSTTITIPNLGMGYFYDGNKSKWQSASTITRSKYDIEPVPQNASSASDWKYTYNMPSTWKTTLTSVYIDPSFINFPIRSLSYMFDGFSKIGSLQGSIEYVQVFGVTNLSSTFNTCSGLVSLNLEKWDVRNVTNVSSCFRNCTNTKLTWLCLKNWELTKCTDFSYMFYGAKSLEHIYVADASVNWYKAGQTQKCTSLLYQNLVLHNVDTSKTGQYGIKNCFCDDENHPSTTAGLFETWRG